MFIRTSRLPNIEPSTVLNRLDRKAMIKLSFSGGLVGIVLLYIKRKNAGGDESLIFTHF